MDTSTLNRSQVARNYIFYDTVTGLEDIYKVAINHVFKSNQLLNTTRIGVN